MKCINHTKRNAIGFIADENAISIYVARAFLPVCGECYEKYIEEVFNANK